MIVSPVSTCTAGVKHHTEVRTSFCRKNTLRQCFISYCDRMSLLQVQRGLLPQAGERSHYCCSRFCMTPTRSRSQLRHKETSASRSVHKNSISAGQLCADAQMDSVTRPSWITWTIENLHSQISLKHLYFPTILMFISLH